MSSLALIAAVLIIVPLLSAVAVRVIRRPQQGVLLLVALVPFDGLLLILPVPGALGGWKEGLTLALLGATFLAPASARAPVRRSIPAWAAPALGFVTVAFLWLLVSGPSSLIGFKIACFFLITMPLVLWRCPFNAKERDQLVTVLMVGSFITAVIGLVQQVLGPAFLVSLGYEWNVNIRTSKALLRSISTFEQPFPFAYFVMTALAVAIPVALHDMERRRNRLYLFATPIIVLGMASAIVRGAFVGIAFAVFVIVVYRYRLLVHLLAPVMIAAIALSGQISNALFSTRSLFERTERWGFVLDHAVERPLGGGLTTSGAAADTVREAPIAIGKVYKLYVTSASPQPDNYYLKVLMDLGVPGMWMMLLIVFFGIRYGWRTMRTADGADAALAAGITAAMSAAASAALVSTYFEIFPADMLFWLLLGVLPSLDPSFASTHSPTDPVAAASRPTSENSSEVSLV